MNNLIILSFGEVFFFENDYYIFLGDTGRTIYAAKILDVRQSWDIEKYQNDEIKRNGTVNLNDRRIFSFVILKTDQFRDRAASFVKPDIDGSYQHFIVEPDGKSIIDEDILALRDRVLEMRTVPQELRDIINDLDFTEYNAK